jgi:hypothetical protein
MPVQNLKELFVQLPSGLRQGILSMTTAFSDFPWALVNDQN